MRQLLQNLRNGKLTIEDVPAPARPDGYVLVANRSSLISAGTERATVQAAKASLLGKARQRPDKVRQVLDNVRKEGIAATLKKVNEKLDQPKALGYSSAGVVVACDADEPRLRVGDRVACGGQDYASHAEIVCVPRNLVVPLPDAVDFDGGAFAAVGAIALQGVRRAEIQFGSRVLVIGLGLLGQITWQLLEDAGCTVVGTDVSAQAVELARRLGLARAVTRGQDDVEGACAAASNGMGIDAVLVTASTSSKDPVELAGTVCRERARVVIVGAVPMDVPREPYYRKELDLVLSRSYGPGRYDPVYEEGGVDYPYGHVRWTEGRNMTAFLESVARGRTRLAPLITHRFPLERAEAAYRIVSGENPEPHVGIVLQYPDEPDLGTERTVLSAPALGNGEGALRIGFVGAGSFARSYLIPHLKGRPGIELAAVATAKGFTASDAARKFGFSRAGSDASALISDSRIDALFIATRHDQHGPYAARALSAGKHVFVEKPLAVCPEHLAELLPAARAAGRIIQTGFNRRFSPLAVALRDVLRGASAPVSVTYRVNAGPLPAEHWLLDASQGGGRIVGEGCHFIDLMQFLCGSRPVAVHALSFGGDAAGATSISVAFEDGATGVLVYQANASPLLPKERIEAFAGGRGGIVHDWREVELFDGRRKRCVKAKGQAKGYEEEVVAFLEAVRSGKPAISLESQALTTAATFAIVRSIREGVPVAVALPGE